MSTESPNGRLLIFRSKDRYKGLSVEQMQQIAVTNPISKPNKGRRLSWLIT